MQRDLKLIRDLLLFYESDCSIDFPDAEGDSIRQHMCMLVDAGLLDGQIESGGTGQPQSVTSNDGCIIEKNGRPICRFAQLGRVTKFSLLRAMTQHGTPLYERLGLLSLG